MSWSRRLVPVKNRQADLFLAAPFLVGLLPVFVATHDSLLRDHQFDKGFAMRVFLQFLEGGFLRLGHGTPDAMTFTFELADADAGAGNFRHVVLAGFGPVVRSGLG